VLCLELSQESSVRIHLPLDVKTMLLRPHATVTTTKLIGLHKIQEVNVSTS